MGIPRFIPLGLSLLVITSCGGMTSLSPAGPSSMIPAQVTAAPQPSPIPAPSVPVSRLISGTVGPLFEGRVPCFADRFPCEVYDFSLSREGLIEITLTWDGPPRAMMVQLYWAGEGLAHEEVAPQNGPSRIWFQRPRMEAAGYRVRVVSLEPERNVPFTLTLAY